jgi:AGCS family alanine or glycine:cation symporter
MSRLATLIQQAADALFMPWLLLLLFGTGIFLTVRYRFVQVRRFPEALRTMFAVPDAGAGGALTPFQAFMTALSGTIGTGNIAGVATAIVSGGPGALFWIWAYGFVAMAIKFTEAVLGVTWRETRGATLLAGPMYVLRDGLKAPRLATTYALVAGVAAVTTTPFTQPNSIAVVLESQLGMPNVGSRASTPWLASWGHTVRQSKSRPRRPSVSRMSVGFV